VLKDAHLAMHPEDQTGQVWSSAKSIPTGWFGESRNASPIDLFNNLLLYYTIVLSRVVYGTK
jgi:hypothetical protein